MFMNKHLASLTLSSNRVHAPLKAAVPPRPAVHLVPKSQGCVVTVLDVTARGADHFHSR